MKGLILNIKTHLAFSGILLLITGLIYSNLLISIGVILIFINAFIEQKPIEIFNKIKENKIILLFILLYILHLAGFFYTENTQGYLDDIRIKLPLLLLPVGLTSPSIYNKNTFIRIHVFFIAIVFVTAFITTINYLLDYSNINEMIKRSKPIPVFGGINHIYFGLFMAYSVFAALYIHFKYKFDKQYQRLWWIAIIVLNFIFIHLISSRTGFVTLYAALFSGGIHLFVLKQKRYLTGLISLILLFVLLIFSVNYIKPLQNRYNNTLGDIQVILNNENPNYWSLAQRYEAIIKSIEVFKEQPLTGTGMGDLPDAIEEEYDRNTYLLPENRMMPHNQFITYLTGMGVFALLLFLIIIIYPLFIQKLRNSPFIIGFWFAMVLALLFESMLQRQAGISFFAFFWVYLFIFPSLSDVKTIRDI